MALVRIENDKGQERWIDPESVRLVLKEDHGEGLTMIVLDEIHVFTRSTLKDVVDKINKELR